ncbi:hypothetical protein BCR44DRAFT_66437 [Catenaria anguillulae PL171]|uniref:Uncharacterized protein n=1 Tax=Catenaria anguillulae PL171 TaxID=765915 RepID=A0A1Y2HFV4_9FUNG|nr:hypothetical protein BCR44DRAFT_66437 [Catenaria anguillulae PL171]
MFAHYSSAAATLGRRRLAAAGPPVATRRHLSFLSPRQVLRYSGQSWVATAVTLAALTLFIRPDWQDELANEAAHLSTSVDWTQSALEKRQWAYKILAKVPRNAVAPVDPADSTSAAKADAANKDAPGAHIKIHAFGRDLVDTDLSDLDVLLARIRSTLTAASKDLVPESIRATVADTWSAIRPAVHSSKPVTDLRSATSSTSLQDKDRLPFARPDVGTRAFAWLIDSACVGLLASPFWRGPIYGAVVTLAWLGKDYIFPLLPGVNASPGYHLLGLEKVHVAVANQARSDSKPADPAHTFAAELPGMLGHNSLRFLTWCNSVGAVSGVASLAWCAYAVTNGVEATMVAWDKLAGVQVVHRDDLVEFEATGKVPIRHVRRAKFSVDVESDDIKGQMVDTRTGKVVDWKLETVAGGGEGNPCARLVVSKRVHVDGKVEVVKKEIELPNWVTIKKD